MSAKFYNGIDMVSTAISNLTDPSSAQQAATKNYVDNIVRGLDWKQEVIAASTGNVTLSSPGTSLDGITLTANDRVLLKDQTAPAENGIYVWTASGSPLTRALDADSGAELSGSTVTVQRGTVNADRIYRVTTDDAITVGTTAITLAQVGGGGNVYTAGNGLTLSSFDFNVGAGTGITVGADTVGVDTAVVVRKFAANIGNGSSTSIAVNHALSSTDVTVSVKLVSTSELVYPDVVVTDANNVTLTFAVAPTTNQFRVVVHA